MANTVTMNLTFNSDDDGFLRRECPTCSREFKWISSLGANDDSKEYFCPYCGVPAPGDHWWTTAQLDYIRAAGQAMAEAEVLKALQSSLRSSKHLSFTAKSRPDFDIAPPGEENDMLVAEFPCHPESKIKVESLGTRLFCVVCGEEEGARSQTVRSGWDRPESPGGKMQSNWRIHQHLLSRLAKAFDGELPGVEDRELHGQDLSASLEAIGLGVTPTKLRSQLDYLRQRNYIDLKAPGGAGMDPLECFCTIRATGQEIAGAWGNTLGQATLLLELLYRASHDQLEGVKTHQGDIFYSEALEERISVEFQDPLRLFQYLEAKGYVQVSWIGGNVPMKTTLTSRGIDRVEGITLNGNVRRDQADQQTEQKQSDKLTVLFLAANPTTTQPLSLDQEARNIEEKITMAMGASDKPRAIDLKTAWAVRPDDLLHQLNKVRPHIVHFSGHGGAGELCLCDGQGNPTPVNSAALKALFRTLKDNITVVVLNACYTEQQARVINDEIDYVIGMNQSISDEAARVFAASFYRALAFNRTIQEAFDQAVVALMLEGIPEENTPVLLTKQKPEDRSGE